MKLRFIAALLAISSAAAYGAPAYRLPDMPRNPRTDSACISKTTADTAGSCPRQVFVPGKSQAMEGYSPVYHKD
ncbi:hypothetical protein GTU79_08150 [Sodalis ligni]|jgi:hypothetical protein|uniref:Multiple antibiotic resistance protein MarB n=1 Tax=Sodalis ligni TaxID=2697027 RepID=A0A4R1N929_9GAMM|nr:hypothetical protein [Sodalis ligni]QWA12672.1 hypothetical protein GTU79_08150 [Sodalis ligni]TCL03874.1 hypothetical protein EZJ58_1964 [Sodalis ligni]